MKRGVPSPRIQRYSPSARRNLYSIRNGRRPGFSAAAPPEMARARFDDLVQRSIDEPEWFWDAVVRDLAPFEDAFRIETIAWMRSRAVSPIDGGVMRMHSDASLPRPTRPRRHRA